MSVFQYTDDFGAPGSSVIRNVFYDEVTKTLLVILNNGTRCAYANVPTGTYAQFNRSNSVGAYWNQYIKNHFQGINTDEFEDVARRKVETVIDATEDELAFTRYAVGVRIDGVVNQAVDALDVESAIREVTEKFAALGLSVRVVSVNERD